jgi:prolyl-tRNA synthetase
VPTEYGEDIVYFCTDCGRHQNKELVEKDGSDCPHCGGKREGKKTIEVGNIFKLKTKFSNAFSFQYADEEGNKQDVVMGCYGIGPSRVLGSVVEIHHDERGMIWPESIAPFAVHLVSLAKDDTDVKKADELYHSLQSVGIEVLYDDRPDTRAGEKFADSDLIGIPKRLVVSKKTLENDSVELKLRTEKDVRMVGLSNIVEELSVN